MRKYVIGAIVGAALMFGIQAGAASLVGSKVAGTKDVTFNGTTVGQAVIINSSSYLPVRSLSNALDLGIDLSGGKINLSEQETPLPTATSEPAATPIPTPDPTINYTLNEINGSIASINAQISRWQKWITPDADPNSVDLQAAQSAIKTLQAELAVWEQRKAALQTILSAPDIVLSGQ